MLNYRNFIKKSTLVVLFMTVSYLSGVLLLNSACGGNEVNDPTGVKTGKIWLAFTMSPSAILPLPTAFRSGGLCDRRTAFFNADRMFDGGNFLNQLCSKTKPTALATSWDLGSSLSSLTSDQALLEVQLDGDDMTTPFTATKIFTLADVKSDALNSNCYVEIDAPTTMRSRLTVTFLDILCSSNNKRILWMGKQDDPSLIVSATDPVISGTPNVKFIPIVPNGVR